MTPQGKLEEPKEPGFYFVRVGPLTMLVKREEVGKYADRSPWFSIDYEGSVPWSEIAKADAIEPIAPPSWSKPCAAPTS